MTGDAVMGPLPPAQGSFWQRLVVAPIAAQLKQGITPEKIALTVALGIVLGVFPVLGAATALCALAGVLLRLNQPIIQLVNYFVYPLQIALLIPFYHAGQIVFRQPPIPLSITFLLDRFRADWWQFLQDFGRIALQGVALWCLLALPLVALLHFIVRGPLRVLARRTSGK